MNAEIVIKKVRKADLESPDNFFDESRALYASAHPNVVQIYHACQDDDHIFLAMPFYRRGSVGDLLQRQFPTVREIVAAGCQILSGLHNIHSKGLIHFDIKPDNVLLSDRGEALVADFGLSKQMNYLGIAAQERNYNKMIPPEGTRGNQFDRTFDIYQLGLTLYRMCNRNENYYQQYNAYGVGAGFDRDRFRNDVRDGRFPDRSLFPAHIPQRLRTLIRKCLEVDPANRYQSARRSLMRKIKNDRANYTTRAGLYAAKQAGRVLNEMPPSRSRENTYLTAPIDRGGYIDFREKPPKNRAGLRRRG